MPPTNAYRDFIASRSTSNTLTPFDNANAHLCVGNGTTAFAATQTDLQGASKARKAMDASYPQISGAAMTFRSTFGTGDANFSWEEQGPANASTGGVLMSRRVASMGTKDSSMTRQLSFTVTLSV